MWQLILDRSEKWLILAESPGFLTTYALASAPSGLLLGLLAGRWLLPVFQALCIFPLFFVLLIHSRWRKVLAGMFLWALVLTVAVIWLTIQVPDFMESRVLLGTQYRNEMFEWIATGSGREGNIGQFLPQHLLHLVIFSVVTFLSAGFLGLVMGSVLMNYMSFYVGSLLNQTVYPGWIILIGWPPWAAVRVVAFILIATALSGIAVDRFLGFRTDFRSARLILLGGLLLLVVDVLLKWRLAPLWQEWLKALTQF